MKKGLRYCHWHCHFRYEMLKNSFQLGQGRMCQKQHYHQTTQPLTDLGTWRLVPISPVPRLFCLHLVKFISSSVSRWLLSLGLEYSWFSKAYQAEPDLRSSSTAQVGLLFPKEWLSTWSTYSSFPPSLPSFCHQILIQFSIQFELSRFEIPLKRCLYT